MRARGRAHGGVLLLAARGRRAAGRRAGRPARRCFSQASRARRISAAPGRKTRTSPSRPSCTRRRTAEATCEPERPIVGRREVLDRDVEAPALGAQDRRAEVRGERPGRERGAHRDERAGPGAASSAQPLDERERDVALQVPLVELVEDAPPRRPSSSGDARSLRARTPSVTKRTRVRALETSSKRTW